MQNGKLANRDLTSGDCVHVDWTEIQDFELKNFVMVTIHIKILPVSINFFVRI